MCTIAGRDVGNRSMDGYQRIMGHGLLFEIEKAC